MLRGVRRGVRVRSHLERPAAGAHGWAAARSPAPASARSRFASAHFDLVTSFDVFQCLPDAVEHDAIARDVARAEAGRPCHPQRRGARNPAAAGTRCCPRKCGATRRHGSATVFDGAGFAIDRLTFASRDALAVDAAGAAVAAVAERRHGRSGGVRDHGAGGAGECAVHGASSPRKPPPSAWSTADWQLAAAARAEAGVERSRLTAHGRAANGSRLSSVLAVAVSRKRQVRTGPRRRNRGL